MVKIILLSGKLHSGKNQVAEYFSAMAGSRHKSDYIAKGVKDGVRQDFQPLSALLNELSDNISYYARVAKSKCSGSGVDDDLDAVINLANSLKLVPDNFYEDKTDISRVLLQVYATEIFRNRVDEDYWVKQFISRVVEYISDPSIDYVFCTDTRYPNEIELIKSSLPPGVEVHTVRIDRPSVNRSAPCNAHHSELALDNYEFDHYILNDGTLDLLKDRAKETFARISSSGSRE